MLNLPDTRMLNINPKKELQVIILGKYPESLIKNYITL